jgi:hypothetical protein
MNNDTQIPKAALPPWEYTCYHCFEYVAFGTFEELEQHTRQTHFMCGDCNNGFLSKTELSEHSCTPGSSFVLQPEPCYTLESASMSEYCEACGIGPFADSNALQEHKATCTKQTKGR